MYILKDKPEDFFVRERVDLKVKSKGKYSLYLLRKKNCSTQEAISIIRERFKLKAKDVGFAGSKDKKAITEQFITIRSFKGLDRDFDFKDFSLKFLGYCDKNLLFGNLVGNHFRIVLRKLDRNEINKIKRFNSKEVLFVNYFGEQRFSKHNWIVGKLLLKKRFEEAVKLILKFGINEEDVEKYWDEKRILLDKTKNRFERNIIKHLISHKNDFVGALRTMPKELLLLYVHSFQSFVFNKALAKIVSENCNKTCVVKQNPFNLVFADQSELKKLGNVEIPLIGFGSELNNYTGNVVREILEEESLCKEDFVIRSIPEISLEGSFRKAVSKAEEFSYNLESEGSVYKVLLEFFLRKGSYATIFIKQLIEC